MGIFQQSLSARFFTILLKRAWTRVVSPRIKEIIRTDEIRRGEWGNFNRDDISIKYRSTEKRDVH